jgi:BirA family biotin operon repressor/biotin-[acetyl-CoA-carboxylase] ligase
MIDWLVLDESTSTQDLAKQCVNGSISVVFAHHQTAGRGRFDRTWHSTPGESLTMSMIRRDAKDHFHPWLLGMLTAIVIAEVLDTKVQWPNDLTLAGKKVGGILTEMVDGVPIVGIGLNLNQVGFPDEIKDSATSLFREQGERYDALEAAGYLVAAISVAPIPTSWPELKERWMDRDVTPGKPYRLPDGRRGEATGIGNFGELVCLTKSGEESVLAADAMFLAPPG